MRKGEESQPVGVGDPPIRVPSSPELTHGGTLTVPQWLHATPSRDSLVSLVVSQLLCLVFGLDEWREINIHSFHLLSASCLVSPKSSRAASEGAVAGQKFTTP